MVQVSCQPPYCWDLGSSDCHYIVLHILRYNFVSDDAFISLRYAANLLAGHGLVFNPGERVEGFTSPLWTLLLAGFGACGFDPTRSPLAPSACSVRSSTLPTTYWLARQCGGGPTDRPDRSSPAGL